MSSKWEACTLLQIWNLCKKRSFKMGLYPEQCITTMCCDCAGAVRLEPCHGCHCRVMKSLIYCNLNCCSNYFLCIDLMYVNLQETSMQIGVLTEFSRQMKCSQNLMLIQACLKKSLGCLVAHSVKAPHCGAQRTHGIESNPDHASGMVPP